MPLGAEYPIPSDQDCMEITSHAHQTFAGAGEVSDSHIRRDGMRPVSTGTGARFMHNHRPTGHDSQYSSGSVSISDSGSASISTSPSSASSSTAYPPFQPAFQPPSSLYPGASQVIPNSLAYTHPVNGVAHIRSTVPPLSSGIANSAIASTHASSLRDQYPTTTPGLPRYGFSPRSHAEPLRGPFGIPDPPRSVLGVTSLALSSPTGVTYAPQYQLQGPGTQMAAEGHTHATLPFEPIVKLHTITGDNGSIEPQIEAKMEKGFFYSSDKCWTCYRRNYFSVQCSFSFHPHTPHGSLFLSREGKSPQRIQATAMSLSATADGTDGKKIELVQHTPKRDKGPQNPVGKIKVAPTPPGRQHAHEHYHMPPHHYASTQMAPFSLPFQSAASPTSHQHAQASQPAHSYVPGTAAHSLQPSTLPPSTRSDPPCQHTFERIQFKSATANNGKRRAQQQYYHLIVELYVDVRNSHDSEPTWVKVAQRASASVVVRGRSPSHYQNEGPQSQGSGRGGAPGMGGGLGGHHHHGSMNGLQGRSMGGMDFTSRSSNMMGGYKGTQYYVDTSPGGSHTASSASSISGVTMDGLVEQTHAHHPHHSAAAMLAEDEEMKGKIDQGERYLYFPSTLYETGLPSVQKYEYDGANGGATSGPPKEEADHAMPTAHSHAVASGGSAWSMRSGGKFQPTETSRGYYPDLNATGY